MPPALVAELSAHLERYIAVDGAALVFVGAKGAPLRRSNFNVVWSRAREHPGRVGRREHARTDEPPRARVARAALRYQQATETRDQAIAQRMDDLITARDATSVVALRVLRGTG